MNLSPRWVEFLLAADLEAVHWAASVPAEATDHDVMAWAREHDFVVVTADLDFGAILAATRLPHPSVIQLRGDDLSPLAIGQLVLSAIRKTVAELMAGAIVSIDTARTRIRVCLLETDR